MKNMYSNQNQQEQSVKEMPVILEKFLKQTRATDFIDTLACEILTDGIGAATAITDDFVHEENRISDIQTVLFDWQGISPNSEYSQILQEIIFTYERAAFRAGFETAKQLLK